MPPNQTKDPKSPLHLPQRPVDWLIATRRLHTWVDDKAGQAVRPYAILIVETHNGYVLDSDLADGRPTPERVRQQLWKAMRKPLKQLRQPPHRPQAVVFEDAELAAALESDLAEIGVAARQSPLSAQVDEIINLMEQSMGLDEDELPALEIPGNEPKQLGVLFAAAADFYRAAPWVYLNDEQPLAYTLEPGGETGFVQLMGAGGVQYGLLLYHNWQDLYNTYLLDGDPIDKVPPTGWVSLSYETEDNMPFSDLDAIEAHGWGLAGEAAYPLFLVFFPDHAKRPGPADLRAFSALLEAIPGFVDAMQPDGHGDYLPLETVSSVQALDGSAKITLKYPAGELRKEAFATGRMDWDDDEDDEDEAEAPLSIPLLRRGMEGSILNKLPELFGDEYSPAPDTPLTQAQGLIYQAWNEPDPARRIQLAHQALKISQDCADAYVLLAEDYAVNVGQAFAYYQKGVDAGRRTLGETFFAENRGEFWGLLDTRPYMRALEGLAYCQVELDRVEEALEIYREMLRLNSGDNQGVRYILLDTLVNLGQDAEAQELIDQYPGDAACRWRYAQALLTFRRDGASPDATAFLLQALDWNPYVPDYLTGRKRIPVNMPEMIGLGDESEAQNYAAAALNSWRRTPGALVWLKNHPLIKPKPAGKPASKAGGKPKPKRR